MLSFKPITTRPLGLNPMVGIGEILGDSVEHATFSVRELEALYANPLSHFVKGCPGWGDGNSLTQQFRESPQAKIPRGWWLEVRLAKH